MKDVASFALAALLLAWAFIPTAAQAADGPSDLAQKAKAVLEANCYRCHGKDGKAEEGVFVLNRDRLVARNKVAPGKATKSVLYNQVVGDDMPPAGESPRPSKDDVEALRQWIDAGAPDFAPVVAVRTFIGPDDVLKAIRDDLGKLGERDRRFARYFTITHLYNASLPDGDLQSYRNGLSKLVNSLSWDRSVTKPEPIDAAQTIFRIDLRDYQWNEKTWLAILTHNPYGLTYDTATAKGVYAATDCPLPYVRGDWFVFAASRPPLYHDVLGMPESAHELETLLRVDVNEDVRQEKRVARAGFNGSGVSDNNRIVERHETGYGAYWRSFDFADSTGRKNVFDHPLDFQPDGGEIIFNLPNHLQAYMLVNNDGKRIDKGPTNIVHDDKQKDRAVANGISCMSCHAQGMIPKTDEVRKAVDDAGGAFTKKELDLVRTLYPEAGVFAGKLKEDGDRFKKALEDTGDHVQKLDTVVLLASRFEEELDLKLAAAEAGMKPDEFLAGLRRSAKVGRVLGPLKSEGGTVKRDVFVQVFGDLARELSLGAFVPPGGGELEFENSVGGKFTLIPSGAFTMGSPAGEAERETIEGPQHPVEITQPFYLGVYPVTQAEYRKVMGNNPSYFSAGGGGKDHVAGLDTTRFPVECVSWNDAVAFCAKLSALDAEKKAGRAYRLPTEAEWEYACRAGTTTPFSFGDKASSTDANFDGRFPYGGAAAGPDLEGPTVVGSYAKNAFGLYDMHGNVEQWCADYYGEDYYKDSPNKDPQGPDKGDRRVQRGGCWAEGGHNCRAAFRRGTDPGERVGGNGFRGVCVARRTP